jgi:hypothetical protein
MLGLFAWRSVQVFTEHRLLKRRLGELGIKVSWLEIEYGLLADTDADYEYHLPDGRRLLKDPAGRIQLLLEDNSRVEVFKPATGYERLTR